MIKRITYEGLAGRDDARSIELNEQVSILFGRNGSGKTSLLELIHLALANQTETLGRIPFVNFSLAMDLGSFSFTREISKALPLFEEAQFSSDLFEPGPKLKVKPPRPAWTTFSRDELPERFSVYHVYLPIFRLYETSRRKTGPVYAPAQNLSDEKLDQYFRDVILTTWQGFTRQFLANVGEVQEAGLASILADVFRSDTGDVEEVAEIRDPAKAYDRLSSFLRRRNLLHMNSLTAEEFEVKVKTDKFMRRVIRDVEDVEERVEIASEPRRNFESLIQELLGSNKRVTFDEGAIKVRAKSGEVIDISRLSSGEKQLIKIALDTVSANGAPVIIDEPELSMHIDWQRYLLGHLVRLSPQSQFIVATHSPDIMAHFSSDNIIEI